MGERMVQVPVSLIERAVHRLIHNTTDAWDVVDELRALLSQPTPTAEPPRVEDMAPTAKPVRVDPQARYSFHGEDEEDEP